MRENDPIDLKKNFFRSNDRFFQANGHWYFGAREGDIGPFRDREQARREAEAYMTARKFSAGKPPRAAKFNVAEPTVIPGYVYRSILSMEQRASLDRDLILELEDFE